MRKEGYLTKNLNIASYLYASGLQLIGTKTANGEVYFLFSPEEEAKKLVDGYFIGSAQVNPRELFARLNDLRDLIFSGGR